MGEHWKQLIIG